MNDAQAGTTPPPREGCIDFDTLNNRVPVSARTLRQWIRDEKLPSIRVKGSRRRIFFWEDVSAALRRMSQGGNL